VNILNNINNLISSYLTYADDTPVQLIKTIMVDNSEELYHLFKTDYSQAIERYRNGQIIYRGVRNYLGPYFIKIPGLRKSNNTYNIYTRLFSGLLPSWDKYPQRNNSFICTTNLNKTRGYVEEDNFTRGQYIVLPKNNAKIGICPFTDIWESFLNLTDYGIYRLYRLNYLLLNFINNVSLHNKKIFIEDDNSFFDMFNYNSDENIKKYFQQLAKHIEENIDQIIIEMNKQVKKFNHNYSEFDKMILQEMYKTKNSYNLLTIFDKILNPKKNGFRLTTINNFKITEKENEYGREVWTDSTCLFININKQSMLKITD